MKVRSVLLSVGVLLLVPCLAHAQGLGAINGTITDPSGAAVANAKVSATQAGTSFRRDADSNSDGFFVLPSLAPASYHISVTATGFKSEAEDVTVLADQSLTVNFQLTLGSAAESVTVSGTALAVDTTTSTLKQVVEQERVNDLPLNGRNVAQLTTAVAGAVISPNGGMDQGQQKTFPGAQTISANGSFGDQTSYLLDGGDYMDDYTNVNQPFPFPDELQEFSVQTNNYTAEYGNNAGAIVNVITKSGTNDFHGDAFEYNRNPVLNALNYLSPTDIIKRNEFGGTVGGPILRNKLYFFAGYQRTTLRNRTSVSPHMPGTTDIANFLANGEPCATQTAGSPTACGTGVIDPSVAKMLGINPTTGAPLNNPTYALAGVTSSGVTNIPTGLSPLACVAGANPCAGFPVPDTENYDSGMGRFDYQLRANDKLTGRYEFDRFVRPPYTPPQELLAYTDGATIISQNALLHETHTFSSTVLNDFRISYSRETSVRGPGSDAPDVQHFGSMLPNTTVPPSIVSISVQNASSSSASPGSGNGFSFGTNAHGEFLRNNVVTSDDISWEKGQHDIHFGGELERAQVDLINEFTQGPSFAFCTNDTFLGTGAPGSSANQTSANAQAEGRYTFTNFLAGDMCDTGSTTYALQQGGGEFKDDRSTFAGIYIQDNYRIRRNLTLNLGMRWEPANMPDEITDHRYTCLNLANLEQDVRSTEFPDSPPGILYAGDPGCPKDGMNGSYHDFMPRIGFAWDVFGDGKTSVRGGAGIFYDSRPEGALNNRFVDQWPFSPQYIESTAATPSTASTAGSFTDPLCTESATQTRLNCSGAQQAAYKVNFPYFPGPYAPAENLPLASSIAYPYIPGNNVISGFSTTNWPVPVTYEYNLTIERQLPGQSVFRVAYVGSVANHIMETIFLNPSPADSPLNPLTGAGPTGSTAGLFNAILTTFNEPGTSTPIPSNTLSPTGILEDAFDVNANYNALQATYEKRATRGLTLLVNYTYSKALDDLPFGQALGGFDGIFSPVSITGTPMCKVAFAVSAGGTGICPANETYSQNRHDFDWGPSDFDNTHVFNATFVYNTPSLSGHAKWMREAFGGYQISGIITAASGRPLTIIENANNISGIDTGSERATLCGQGLVVNSPSTNGLYDSCIPGLSPYNATAACNSVTSNCNGLLTSAAFEPFTVCNEPLTGTSCPSGHSVNNPAIYGTLGSEGKGIFRLPRTQDWDMSFAKTFAITERYGLQLRVDYFNIFNHVNFAPTYSPTTGANNSSANFGGINQLNSSAFGALDSSSGVKAGDPRVAQLSAKFTF